MTPHHSVFADFRSPCLDDLVSYVPGPTGAQVSERYGIPESALVKLSSNEAPLGPADEVRHALRELVDGDTLHRYPSSSMSQLKEAAATVVGRRPEEILLGNGSTETWAMVVRAFTRPGDVVAALEPSMTSYLEIATLAERRTRLLSLSHPFEVDASHVAGQLANVRMLFLSSPNNTTSRLVEPESIRMIATARPNTIVVVDEHYIEAADDYARRSAVTLLDELGNVLVTRSLSKMYGLAGLRLGYLVGPPEAVDAVSPFKPTWNVSATAEVAAMAALGAQAHLARNIEVTRTGRKALLAGLSKLGMAAVPDPQGGFLLFQPTGLDSMRVVDELLVQGIIVRGDLHPGYIRVSAGTAQQNEWFLTALEKVVTAMRGAGTGGHGT